MSTNEMIVQRLSDRPVVAYGSVPGYGAIFNAGLLVRDGVFHLFARGVRDGYYRNPDVGDRFLDYISDVLVFTSVDGLSYEFGYVLAKAGDSGVCCYEDARVQIVREGDQEHIVMTYTNLPDRASGEAHHIGAHRLHWDGTRFHLIGETHDIGPGGIPNKDGIIFNLDGDRVALLHRVHPNMQIAVFDDLSQLWNASDDYWSEYMSDLDSHVIIRRGDARGIGAGAPVLCVEGGLLNFFHETTNDGVYVVKVALHDASTGLVLACLDEPLLVPELDWELRGDVNDVVFVQGAHIEGDLVYLVYGASDNNIGAAQARVSDLLEALNANRKVRELALV
jgi:predicted GH43/DUF377 family glycosyl hydrolase